jgi:threonine dehydratase
MPHVDRAAIEHTYPVIRSFIRRTPLVHIDGSDIGLSGVPLTLKLELMQHAGSFKTRGAFANLLLRDIPAAGVAAASGGNHGAAVAYAARRRNLPARIFVPEVSSPAKIARIRSYGADLVITGQRYQEAYEASQAWIASSHAAYVHAYDQPETLMGAGTLGLEFEQDAPDLDTVLIAVGGGGLIGGVAAWYEGRTRIVGVEPVTAPTLFEARKAGRPVDAPAGGIAADSLAPLRVGELMFPITQQFVERVVLVEDEAIRRAQETLWDVLRVVAEPGAATPFAALTSGAYVPSAGERVGVVVSGGNTTAVKF